ncbi:MAG: uracil-DNA glycosylase [candidate division Zixibacteria bacterium]|nr:uracil-DNA glycosylase [candidate division Zixibacteria bacterium]
MTLKKNIKEPEMPENIQKLEKIEIPDKLEKSIEITKYRSLTGHNKAICNCQNCSLGATRTKFVYGVGNPKADVMFVGEAPGRDEDLSGEPFVGRAGKLLDKILEAIQFSRDNQVYIANILKCRPPNNRDPQPDEMKTCMPYLREQIRILKPKIICALGRVAAQALLDTTTPLGKLRGSWHEFENTPFIVTYHPAALLRFQKYKKDCWEDIKMLKAKYDTLVQE